MGTILSVGFEHLYSIPQFAEIVKGRIAVLRHSFPPTENPPAPERRQGDRMQVNPAEGAGLIQRLDADVTVILSYPPVRRSMRSAVTPTVTATVYSEDTGGLSSSSHS